MHLLRKYNASPRKMEETPQKLFKTVHSMAHLRKLSIYAADDVSEAQIELVNA
jgi:hypothetical protein